MTAVPNEASIAKAESIENHETGRPVRTLPTESRNNDREARGVATARLALAGSTVTFATEAAVPVTWIVIESRSVSLVRVIVAKPDWCPVTEAV